MSLVSDYRYRGLSLSNGLPALQGEIEVATKIGLYAQLWGSTIHPEDGAHEELDISFGDRASLPGHLVLDVGATRFLYPGARGLSGLLAVSGFHRA